MKFETHEQAYKELIKALNKRDYDKVKAILEYSAKHFPKEVINNDKNQSKYFHNRRSI